MYHGNLENSDGCSYLLRICFIHGTKVSVSQSWISLLVVDHEQCVECANQTSANQNTVHLKTGFIWKFTTNDFSIANCEVLDEKHCIAVQRIFCKHYYKLVAQVLRLQTCCLPSLVVKNKPGELVTSLHSKLAHNIYLDL